MASLILTIRSLLRCERIFTCGSALPHEWCPSGGPSNSLPVIQRLGFESTASHPLPYGVHVSCTEGAVINEIGTQYTRFILGFYGFWRFPASHQFTELVKHFKWISIELCFNRIAAFNHEFKTCFPIVLCSSLPKKIGYMAAVRWGKTD